MATETSFGAPPQTKDWRKFVTLDPVSQISFRPVQGDRPSTFIKLINKGEVPIMFKIKTTKPQRYLVRPSQGVVGQNNDVEVQVLFTQDLDGPEEEDAILTDKFLVQLTPAPSNFSLAKLDGRDLMQELIKAWGNVDKKNKYEFRLRVVKRKDAHMTPVHASPAKQTPGAAVGSAQKVQQTPAQSNAAGGAQSEQDLQKQIEQLKKEYQTLQQEKIKTNATLSNLQKLADSKSFDQNKRSAATIGGGCPMGTAVTSGGDKGGSGYQLFHLMLIALVSLLVGAFIAKTAAETAISAADPNLSADL